jgi:hypothetical protein
MDDVEPSRRASGGWSVLVALGWYATVVAAVLVGMSGVPAAPEQDCPMFLGCLTPLEGFVLVLIAGAPVVLGLLLVTVGIAGVLARRVPSAILAGTLAAPGSVAVVAAAAAVWSAVR